MAKHTTAIRVEALKPHTYNGKDYQVGDEYDFYPSTNPSGISADDQVASLQNTGFATRVDRVSVAKQQVKAAEETVKRREKAAVEPMTTDNTGTVAPTRPARAPRTAKAPRPLKTATKKK